MGFKLRARKQLDVLASWIAARAARVAWFAKFISGATAAYALSPIDLITDIIPILGYLDDLLIIPAGIWFALRLIPTVLIEEFCLAASKRLVFRSAS